MINIWTASNELVAAYQRYVAGTSDDEKILTFPQWVDWSVSCQSALAA